MKHNLKNRPKWKTTQGYGEHHYFQSTETWFEGFEKELREKLENQSNIPKEWFWMEHKEDRITADIFCKVETFIIKEILGE